jgi:hypothetical protein
MKIKATTWRRYSLIACCVCPPFGILYLIWPKWWNEAEQITFFGIAFLVGLSGLLKITGIIEIAESKTNQGEKEK